MPELEPLDDAAYQRILVVVAHPDDAEYGLSTVVSRWTRRGCQVAYLLMTSGEAGMQRDPAEAGPLRADEQQRACAAVGVSDLTILDFPDGMLTYGLDLRRAIARKIREFRPEVVVGQSWAIEAPWGGFDQADHRAVGLATLDAIRDADNTWVFPELARDGLAKWATSWLLVSGANPTHYVEIDDEMLAAGVASLSAHERYLADLPWHPTPEEFLGPMLQGQGSAAGVPRAQLFEVHAMGPGAQDFGESGEPAQPSSDG